MKVQLDIDLRSAVPAVRDQGARPTCLAHAATTAHEKSRGSRILLSPEYLHFFATSGVVSSAISFDEIARTLERKGQPIEDDCPYWTAGPPKGWKPRRGLTVFRRASQPKRADMHQVEMLIRSGQAPVLGITLSDGFFVPNPPWIISSDGPLRGLHAVLGVGVGKYGDSRLVLIRNSWGTDWGDAGHAWLNETFVSRHLKDLLILTDEVVS